MDLTQPTQKEVATGQVMGLQSTKLPTKQVAATQQPKMMKKKKKPVMPQLISQS